MIGEDVLYLSVGELGQRIRARSLSPVDLTEAYLQRSERLGPRLNAYATITRSVALEQARTAEREINAGKYRGPLHGIPYAAKDLLAVKGTPTTWGARPFANQQFDYDATVVRKLNAAGAVLIGKAAMIELAGGMGYRFASASLTGPTKNPWNESCWTCGSSSGSGAIVAGALAAFAIGTETWGSIICPSAFCGVSGLRPTFGRVSRHGAMALAYSMDKIGPMARTADDCALVLSAIAGHDRDDPHSLPPELASFIPPQDLASEIRIGWVTNQWKTLDNNVETGTAAAREVLNRTSSQVTDIALPEGPWDAAAGLVVSVEGASAFESLINSGEVAELIDPTGKIGGYISREMAGDDFVRAQRLRGVAQRKMDALFDNFDVLATPSLPTTATPIGANLEEVLNFPDPIGALGNLCGLPALSVPCGFSGGKPLGLQFVGRELDDAAVIRAASLFQHNTEWHRRRPPLA
jgi:aspartyl-tRNA(Asn)/glutamyl-tRNA(Gln) amidotransferase subunit A